MKARASSMPSGAGFHPGTISAIHSRVGGRFSRLARLSRAAGPNPMTSSFMPRECPRPRAGARRDRGRRVAQAIKSTLSGRTPSTLTSVSRTVSSTPSSSLSSEITSFTVLVPPA